MTDIGILRNANFDAVLKLYAPPALNGLTLAPRTESNSRCIVILT